MGTSAAYTPSPQWSQAKSDVTHALNNGPVNGETAAQLVGGVAIGLCSQPGDEFGSLPSDFGKLSPDQATAKLNALLVNFPPLPAIITGSSHASRQVYSDSGVRGTSRVVTTGGRRGGRRGGGGRASSVGMVRPAAQRLASFLSSVPKIGLRQALKEAGISNVDTLAPAHLALAIADVLSSDANQIVQSELRAALVTVLENVCTEPSTLDSAEEMLVNAAYNIADVVGMLFEAYIMERFKTFFCEHEAPKHGFDASDKILAEARQFVSVEMKLVKSDHHDLTAIDWGGTEGANIVDAILERTISIYTGE